MSEVDEYLKKVDPAQRKELDRIRKIVKKIVPNAEEVISYGIPTFKYNKKPLLYYAAFKDHMSIYPVSDGMVEEIGEELAKFRTSKGTLQFTETDPISDSMLKKIIHFRLKSIRG